MSNEKKYGVNPWHGGSDFNSHSDRVRQERLLLMEQDVNFVKSILPDHYIICKDSRLGSIHVKSEKGIRKPPYFNQSTGTLVTDAEDEEHWSYILKALKKHSRFQEVYHNTCFCHVDFIIYFKPTQP